MDDTNALAGGFVHLARLALAGRRQDIELYLRRSVKHYRLSLPQLADQLSALLRNAPTQSSPLRRTSGDDPLPVDLDTRLQLVRVQAIYDLDIEPVYTNTVWAALRQLVAERRRRDVLEECGLAPTRTALFTGPPGVGKTLAAKWLARELKIPLLTLDLSAVMSSFLGRTGNNLRHVLDYAKNIDCILLLDEFDAIAKRRDDITEVGELKRLVTVLLQEIDDWPVGSLLIAATNHPDLLDPAVWRRFETSIVFPMPTDEMIVHAVRRFLGPGSAYADYWPQVLSFLFQGVSFSDIERKILAARRAATITGEPLDQHLVLLVRHNAASLTRQQRVKLAAALVSSGLLSQRVVYKLIGVSRDTIRKALASGHGR